jgi:anti-anti-sigma factor
LTLRPAAGDDRPPPERPAFACRLASDRDAVRLRVAGELDIETVARVHARLDELRASGADRIVLDLRDTRFVDSAGLELAVLWHRRSLRERFGFALVPGPGAVHRVFEAAGLVGRLRFIEPD